MSRMVNNMNRAAMVKYLDFGLEVELLVIKTSHKACFYTFLDHHCLVSGLRHSQLLYEHPYQHF